MIVCNRCMAHNSYSLLSKRKVATAEQLMSYAADPSLPDWRLDTAFCVPVLYAAVS